MTQIAVLEAQPAFPEVDLTDTNAKQLELMLANRMFVTQAHELADRTQWVFRAGHPGTVGAGRRIFDGAYVEALGHGVVLFEAMCVAVVGLRAARLEVVKTNRAVAALVTSANEGELRTHSVTVLDEFRERMPNATSVIIEAGSRFVGPLTDYALMGAALERQIVLDSIPDLSDFVEEHKE